MPQTIEQTSKFPQGQISYKVTKLYYLAQIRSLFPIGSKTRSIGHITLCMTMLLVVSKQFCFGFTNLIQSINITRPESDWPVNWAIVWCGLVKKQTSRHTAAQELILEMFYSKYVSKIYLPSMEFKSHVIWYQILQLLNSMLSDIDCELFVCFSLGLKVQNLPREESAVSCRFLLRTEEIKCRCFNNHVFMFFSGEIN